MVKRLLFLSLGCAAVSAFAMEMEPHKEWVRQASSIKVNSMKIDATIPIDDYTTVLDAKKYLEEREGVPTGQQRINAVWPILWSLNYLKDKSAPLVDDVRIKDAMDLYNTRTFTLQLQLRSQAPADNKN